MIETRVYTRAQVPIDVVGDRIAPSFQIVKNDAGVGSFQIRVDSGTIVRSPTLLNYGNVVKMKINGLTYAWVIEKKKRVLVGSGERKEWRWDVSGRGALVLLQEALVYPEYGVSKTAGPDRYFTFAADTNDWTLVPAQWTNAVAVKQSAVTSRRGSPTAWPDGNACWIWNTNPVGVGVDDQVMYLRKTFTTAAAVRVTVYAAADDEYDLWVDGQLILHGDDWHTMNKKVIRLKAGSHVVAARAVNGDHTGANPGAFIMTMKKYDDPLHPVVCRTDASWKCRNEASSPVPGFNAGQIEKTLIDEARARGVGAVQSITYDWTPTLDSLGQPWARQIDRVFGVGTDLFDVTTQIAETLADVRMTGDLVLQLAEDFGVDRTVGSTPVVFRAAKNVKGASYEGDGSAIRTVLLVQTDLALTETVDAAAAGTYGRREGYLSVGDSMSATTTARVVAYAVKERKAPSESFEVEVTDEITAKFGTDWNVGDIVYGPGDNSALVKYMVQSVSVAEDENGKVTIVPELSSLLQRSIERFNRWLKSMVNGTFGGSVASASPLRNRAGAGGGGGAGDGSGGGGSQFFRDRFVLTVLQASGSNPATLTYDPAIWSPHVYLNGLEQDEGVDYTIDGRVITILPAMDARPDAVLDVRYAYAGVSGSIVGDPNASPEGTPTDCIGYPEAVANDVPVAYWRLGEASGAALDSSGHGHVGVWNSEPIRSQASLLFADSNPSIGTTGSGCYFTVPYSSAFATSAWTFEWWSDKGPVAGHAILLDWPGRLQIAVGNNVGTDGVVHVGFYTDATNMTVFDSPGAFTETATYGRSLYQITYDGTVLRFKRNGVTIATVTPSVGMRASTSDLKIGCVYGAFTTSGRLDEIAWYSSALSDDQAFKHWEAASCHQVSPLTDGFGRSGDLHTSHTDTGDGTWKVANGTAITTSANARITSVTAGGLATATVDCRSANGKMTAGWTVATGIEERAGVFVRANAAGTSGIYIDRQGRVYLLSDITGWAPGGPFADLNVFWSDATGQVEVTMAGNLITVAVPSNGYSDSFTTPFNAAMTRHGFAMNAAGASGNQEHVGDWAYTP